MINPETGGTELEDWMTLAEKLGIKPRTREDLLARGFAEFSQEGQDGN